MISYIGYASFVKNLSKQDYGLSSLRIVYPILYAMNTSSW